MTVRYTQARRMILRIGVLTMALGLCSCGGRTQLIPAHQIGRLSSDAVVANDAGVRVVVGRPHGLGHLWMS